MTAQQEADEMLARARAEVERLQQLDDDSRAQVRRHAEALLSEALLSEADGPIDPS